MENVLINKYVVEIDEEDYSVLRVGKIIGQINADTFLVQLYVHNTCDGVVDEANMLTPFTSVDILGIAELKQYVLYHSFKAVVEAYVRPCDDCKRWAMDRSKANDGSKRRLCFDCLMEATEKQLAATRRNPWPDVPTSAAKCPPWAN